MQAGLIGFQADPRRLRFASGFVIMVNLATIGAEAELSLAQGAGMVLQRLLRLTFGHFPNIDTPTPNQWTSCDMLCYRASMPNFPLVCIPCWGRGGIGEG